MVTVCLFLHTVGVRDSGLGNWHHCPASLCRCYYYMASDDWLSRVEPSTPYHICQMIWVIWEAFWLAHWVGVWPLVRAVIWQIWRYVSSFCAVCVSLHMLSSSIIWVHSDLSTLFWCMCVFYMLIHSGSLGNKHFMIYFISLILVFIYQFYHYQFLKTVQSLF